MLDRTRLNHHGGLVARVRAPLSHRCDGLVDTRHARAKRVVAAAGLAGDELEAERRLALAHDRALLVARRASLRLQPDTRLVEAADQLAVANPVDHALQWAARLDTGAHGRARGNGTAQAAAQLPSVRCSAREHEQRRGPRAARHLVDARGVKHGRDVKFKLSSSSKFKLNTCRRP